MAQGGWSRTSRTIKAIQKALYDAFMDPDQLIVWLAAGSNERQDAFLRWPGGWRL